MYTALLPQVPVSALHSCGRIIAVVHKRSGEISDQRVTIEASIHDTIRRLHEIIDVRKTELMGQLHQMIQRKLKDIASQRDQMETIQAQLNSCLHFVTDSLKTGSQGEVLKIKITIVKIKITIVKHASQGTDHSISTTPTQA